MIIELVTDGPVFGADRNRSSYRGGSRPSFGGNRSRGRGRGGAGRGGAGRGGRGGAREQKKTMTAEELDKQLDDYKSKA